MSTLSSVVRITWRIAQDRLTADQAHELTEEGVARACAMIGEGYREGELIGSVNAEEIKGWWSLERITCMG